MHLPENLPCLCLVSRIADSLSPVPEPLPTAAAEPGQDSQPCEAPPHPVPYKRLTLCPHNSRCTAPRTSDRSPICLGSNKLAKAAHLCLSRCPQLL